jgi:hypothetical protein
VNSNNTKRNETVKLNMKILPEWRPNREDVAPELAELPRWSGRGPLALPPAIGARVFALGGFGWSEVVSYFENHGYLGVELRPEVLPDWFVNQSPPDKKTVHVFGAEIMLEEPTNV